MERDPILARRDNVREGQPSSVRRSGDGRPVVESDRTSFDRKAWFCLPNGGHVDAKGATVIADELSGSGQVSDNGHRVRGPRREEEQRGGGVLVVRPRPIDNLRDQRRRRMLHEQAQPVEGHRRRHAFAHQGIHVRGHPARMHEELIPNLLGQLTLRAVLGEETPAGHSPKGIEHELDVLGPLHRDALVREPACAFQRHRPSKAA